MCVTVTKQGGRSKKTLLMPDGTRYGNTPVVPVTGSNEELCAYLDLPAVVQADGLVSVEDVHTCLTLLDQA